MLAEMKDVQVTLTAEEANLLIQTVEAMTYPGKIAGVVFSILAKLTRE